MVAATPFSAFEASVVLAFAITLTLLGMWLTGRVTRGAHFVGRAPAAHAGLFDMPARASDRNRLQVIRNALARLTDRLAMVFRPALRLLPAASRSAPLRSNAAANAAKRRNVRTAVRAPAARLSVESQWDRATRTITSAIDTAATIRSVHAAASDKLDAATYTLDKLLAELDGVIKLKPAKVGATLLPMQAPLPAAGPLAIGSRRPPNQKSHARCAA